jgi:hypothetical protein
MQGEFVSPAFWGAGLFGLLVLGIIVAALAVLARHVFWPQRENRTLAKRTEVAEIFTPSHSDNGSPRSK